MRHAAEATQGYPCSVVLRYRIPDAASVSPPSESRSRPEIVDGEIWLKHYSAGVPAQVRTDRYTSLLALLEAAFSKAWRTACVPVHGPQLQLRRNRCGGRRWRPTFRAAAWSAGIAWPSCCPMCAGYVVVNVNPLYTPSELEHQLKNLGARAIVVLENFAATLQQVLDAVPILFWIWGFSRRASMKLARQEAAGREHRQLAETGQSGVQVGRRKPVVQGGPAGEILSGSPGAGLGRQAPRTGPMRPTAEQHIPVVWPRTSGVRRTAALRPPAAYTGTRSIASFQRPGLLARNLPSVVTRESVVVEAHDRRRAAALCRDDSLTVGKLVPPSAAGAPKCHGALTSPR